LSHRSNKTYSIPEIQEIVAPFAKEYGVEKVYLFGSYARGEATTDSDVDLRIDSGKIKTLFTLGGFYADLKESLGKPIDIVTSDAISEKFHSHIEREEVVIYERQ